MDDIESAISAAWNEIAPKLLADPEELNRRLARRKLKHFARPLRAWCVAIRASDHRITPMDTIIVPRHAVYLDAESHPGRYAEHEITLTKDLLVRLCQPVEIGRPGEPADEVAKRLGCHPATLMRLRRNGFLRTTPKPGLRGRHGPPVPLIYTPEYLDPQAYGHKPPDDVFGSCWLFRAERLVDGFTQTVTRIPRYHYSVRGIDRFQGWHWICPCCRKSASILFCPVDQPDFPSWIGFAPALAEPMPKPTPIFACKACHGVLGFSRGDLSIRWNILILRYSGGLLYGHEVQKPEWLTPRRTRPCCRPKPRPAPRRSQVERLLVDTDLSYSQIAARMGTGYGGTVMHAFRIFKCRNVRNRAELRALLRPAQAAPRAAG